MKILSLLALPFLLRETKYIFKDKYVKTTEYRIGVEALVPVIEWYARLGYMRCPLAYRGPREEGDPLIEIMNERDFITVGLGKLMDENIRFDVSFIHGFWSQEEASRADDETQDKLFVSLTYRL